MSELIVKPLSSPNEDGSVLNITHRPRDGNMSVSKSSGFQRASY